MGKYGAAETEEYDEKALDKLVARYGDTIDKYMPGLSLEDKATQAISVHYMSESAWIEDRKLRNTTNEGRELKGDLKKGPTLEKLGKFLAHKTATELRSFGSGLALMGKGTLRNPWDPQAGAASIERDKLRKRVLNQAAVMKGGYTKGEGPGVWHGVDDPSDPKWARLNAFKGKGTFGSPLIVIKKGQDMEPTGAMKGTRISARSGNRHSITCFIVPQRGFSVIKQLGDKSGGLKEWFDEHADHYLVRLETGSATRGVDDTSGQNVQTLTSKDISARTICAEVEAFKGLYLEEDQYEVIDTGMAAAKLLGTQALNIGATGIAAALPAPSDWAEMVRSAKELAETAIEAIDGVLELLGEHESEVGDSGLVSVTFSPTGGAAVGSATPHYLDCGPDTFRVGSDTGRGVKISEIMDEVLELAEAG